MDDANQRATGAAPRPVLRSLRQPDRALVRGGDRRARGRRGRDGVRLGHGRDRDDRAGALLGGRSHRRRRASSTPARWRSCRARARASASRRRSSTARVPARSRRRCSRVAPRSCWPRRRPTRASSCATSTRSARSPARSRSSTRRSPRRSASSRWRTASTSCCTRRPRASPATTTPRSVSSPASASCSTRSGAYGVLHGAMASPFDALNALRGVRTMAVRTAHQAATAQRLAEWLEQHPGVAAVHYPGLASHPQHDLAKRQMRQFGTVLAFDLAGGRDAVQRLLDEMRLARCATSLGGPETLVCHPMTTTHVSLTPEEQAESRRHARAWCGCRSGSRTPTTSSPTSSGRWPSCDGQPHREAASTIGSSAGPEGEPVRQHFVARELATSRRPRPARACVARDVSERTRTASDPDELDRITLARHRAVRAVGERDRHRAARRRRRRTASRSASISLRGTGRSNMPSACRRSCSWV